MTTLPFAHARQQWLRLLGLDQPLGFCYLCQRPTEWLDLGAAYACRQCGHDPLHSAPAPPLP